MYLSKKLLMIVALCGSGLIITAQVVKPVPLVNSDVHGRYQILFSPFARADEYLVDTANGRIWQRTRLTDIEGEPEIWVPQDRLDARDDLDIYISTHHLKYKTQSSAVH